MFCAFFEVQTENLQNLCKTQDELFVFSAFWQNFGNFAQYKIDKNGILPIDFFRCP